MRLPLLLLQQLRVGKLTRLKTTSGIGGKIQTSCDNTCTEAVEIIFIVVKFHVTFHNVTILAGSSPINDTPKP